MNATRRNTAEPAPGRTGSDAALRGALLIGVAVIIGLLLLWSGHDDDSSTVTSDGGATVTTVANGGTSPDGTPATTPGETTIPPPTTHAPAEVKVLVANGGNVKGGAGTVSGKLQAKAYFVLPAANASSEVARSVVYFREGYEADAAQIARDLGVPEASISGMLEAMPATPPVAEAAMTNAQNAHVLVMLGTDNVIQAA